ncbi:hypothetical protein HG443_003275 [Candidatus Saccharibacteria bacterium]|nr:hypothetical protein [Candidatus Saccharibacteria bacterium]
MGVVKLGKHIKKHRALVVILIIILAVVIFARTCIWRDYTKEQIEMAKYLKDKYNGQEFVVEKPELKGAMLGIEGYFSATAYPANNSKIRFTVMYSPSDRYDGYAGAIWSNEESERLKPEIYRLFGKGTDYTVEIKSAMTLQTAKIDMDIRGKIPTFKDAVKKYGKQIPYGLTIKRLKKNLSDDEKEDIVNKLIEISSLLPDETDITITYISETSEKREYGLIESPDDLRKLNSREDKVKKFREWEIGL